MALVDPKRLKSQLQTTQLFQRDNPTAQLLSQIIDALSQLSSTVTSGGGGGGGTTVTNITNIIQGGPPGIEGDPGEDAPVLAGTPGQTGAQGITGSQGPAGSLIPHEDLIEEYIIPIIQVGTQGPAGTTGSQGPSGLGPIFFPGEDGDDGFTIPGPAGASGTSGGSFINVTSLTLTDAQVRALNTVPVTIIPAQGAGIIIIPELFIATMDVTSGFSSQQTFSLRWSGQATLCLPPGISLSINSIAKRIGYSNSTGAALLLNGSTSTYENVAVEVTGGVTPTGGTSRGGCLITVGWTTTIIP